MKRAIIYGRKSTTKQSLETIETQIEECKKWAKDNDCIIVGIYDDSESGKGYNVANRDGFQQITQDAKMGKMDYALIHKVDRFARNVADYFIQERILEQYGVKIVAVGMPYFQDADIVTKSVHIAMAEQFSVNLSDEVSSKMRTFARKKMFLGGTPPYGFKVVGNGTEKTLEIDIEKAQGIKLAYQCYLNGYGYVLTSKILAQNGYLNNKGKPFTPSHIRNFLTSKKYNGYYVFGIREKIKGKDRKTNNPDKLIEIPNVYDKIIDDETFTAVQKKMNSKEPKNKRKSRFFPFTGLITCAECGSSFVGGSTTKSYGKYIYYRCIGYRTHKCKMKSLRADHIEDFIAEIMQRHIMDDAFTEKLIKEVEVNLSGDAAAFKGIKYNIEKELTETNAAIKNATKDKYFRRISDEEYEEVVEELKEEQMNLQIRLANIQEQLNVQDKTEDIKNYVEWLKNNFVIVDEDIRNILLQQVVQKIIVSKDQVDIYLFLTNPSAQSLSNIEMGVPLFTIGKHGKVYINNGLSLLSFQKNNHK